MSNAFIDSGGFFAFLVEEDDFHARAVEIFREARSERWSLLTTNAVVFETHALLISRVRNGRTVALRFLDAVAKGFCRVERVTQADEASAVAIIRAHDDKDYSMCDAISFVVMERLEFTSAIAFDGHFREYGRFTVY